MIYNWTATALPSKGPKDTSMTLEREAKLAATAGFQMPSMDGLVTRTTAVTRPVLELEACYYDTADLRLARWGITLRHRSGEGGLHWTLKLPSAVAEQTVERQELVFAGDPALVPPEAADLIRAYVRGRSLTPVARLHTSRNPIEIRAPDGLVLAEIVDDLVSVRVGRRVTRRFREIEIEVKDDSGKGRAALRAAVDRLTAAGCRREQPVPKLIRALGARASRPADVAVPSLSPHPRPVDLARHAIAETLVQLIQTDAIVRLGDDEEGVHKFRVATRRLRSDLGTFAASVDVERAAWLREELRWVGTEVGRLRDNHVLAGNLQRAIESLPAADRPLAEMILTRLRRQAWAARATMLAALRSERYIRLVDGLVRLAGPRPRPPQRGLQHRSPDTVIIKPVRRAWRRLAAAVDALGDDPTDAALHEVRIKAKRCRYTAEALTPVVGKRAARFAEAVSSLQTVLGNHQDTVVAERWLRETAAAMSASRLVAGELIAHQRGERVRLRAEWPSVWKKASAKRLRAWF
jgi:CHAD domain-containing protein